MQLEMVYGNPGFLLLAIDDDGERLGCIGLRDIDDPAEPDVKTGEIRRLFVREPGRRAGVGAELVEHLLHEAQQRGFERLVLNTVPSMKEAIALYGRVGFSSAEPYVEEPLEDTLYFARRVSSTVSTEETT